MNIGFNSALSGLAVAQRQLDIASHNIANASTEGYSRQRVDQSEADPSGFTGSFNQDMSKGMVGTGVAIQQIGRIRDGFIDRQVRAETSPLGEATVKADTLKQVEDVFGEPNSNGLSVQMGKFFEGWHNLAGDPSNNALRTNLRQQGINLASGFQDLHQKLLALRQDVNDRIGTKVTEINTLSKQIAGLNHQIKAAIAAGQMPNDLLDKQDLLIEQLSQKVAVQVVTSPSTGGRNVYLNGQPLVGDEHHFDLNAVPTLANGFTTITYAPTGLNSNPTGGELKGLLDARDVTLSDTAPNGYIKQVNDLAAGLMASVNSQHTIGFGTTGITGQTFFDGTDASDMTVNAAITTDTALGPGLSVIAAAANDPGSLTGGVADNAIALNIAQLQNGKIMNGGTTTFDSNYKDMITQLGTEAQEANTKTTTQTTLVASVKARRDQVSGVSTDEEMANVVRFQKAYAASAKVITTLDQMLDVLLSIKT
jgi:flagellar hook-associated protein 1 FlgK